MASRVLVVDAHPVTRFGLVHLLGQQPDLLVLGETGSADEARAATAAHVPDVVVLGLTCAGAAGLTLARELRDRFDDLGLVVLGAADDDEALFSALDVGVSAFLPKSAPVAEVVAAVRHAAVSAGSFLAPGLAAALRRRRETLPDMDLSTRERQVLDLLVAGWSVPGLAAALHISPSTGKTYVARLYDKLGARNRAEAVMAAVRLGYTPAEAPGVVGAGRAARPPAA